MQKIEVFSPQQFMETGHSQVVARSTVARAERALDSGTIMAMLQKI